eukprot:scaffold1306_cov66-Phaeocystis_antarctica.AAC.3
MPPTPPGQLSVPPPPPPTPPPPSAPTPPPPQLCMPPRPRVFTSMSEPFSTPQFSPSTTSATTNCTPSRLSGPRNASSRSAASSSAAPPTQYSISTPCLSFAASSGRYPATSPRTRAPAFRWKRSPRSLPFSTWSAYERSPSAVHSRQRVTPHTLCTPASCAWRSTKERSTSPRLPVLGRATTPSSCVTAPRGVCSVASVSRTALRSTWMAKVSGNRQFAAGFRVRPQPLYGIGESSPFESRGQP